MACDSYFSIGGGHQVCQDYALHGTLDDLEYVVVSDGCSSAEYSEIGAQILCHAAKYHIILCYQTGVLNGCSSSILSSVLGNSILKRIDEIRKIYPITKNALEATLLIAVKIKSKVFVFGWGDGVIIECWNDSIFVTKIDSDNSPFYLIYDKEQYREKKRELGIDDPKIMHVLYQLGTEKVTTETFSFDTPFIKYLPYFENLRSISICSDGILSFKDRNKEPLDLLTMVPEFIQYKSIVGDFVKRRMWFLKKKVEKENWSYFDDISCGTIMF